MARKGLPKSYIKKYGITKKAWSEYRKSLKAGGSRKTTKKSKKTNPSRGGNTAFSFGGGFGKGLMAGVAVGVINRVIPINIAGADYIIAGMVMKEPLLQKLGAITLGRSLAGSLTGGLLGGLGGGNGLNGGGGY